MDFGKRLSPGCMILKISLSFWWTIVPSRTLKNCMIKRNSNKPRRVFWIASNACNWPCVSDADSNK